MLVGDGEIGADLVLDRHHRKVDAAAAQQLFQALAGIAAGGEHGEGLAAPGMEDPRRIDAASARRFAARFDVGTILERQAIDADGAVDRRINRKCDNQSSILRRIGTARASNPGEDADADH